ELFVSVPYAKGVSTNLADGKRAIVHQFNLTYRVSAYLRSLRPPDEPLPLEPTPQQPTARATLLFAYYHKRSGCESYKGIDNWQSTTRLGFDKSNSLIAVVRHGVTSVEKGDSHILAIVRIADNYVVPGVKAGQTISIK
ncbi:hypothetical protein N7519_007287, partial [Penicillium mononematosum]|uniref:uncharacterized protein n=1 Tax=Penicillium mononematosum TaxID=268346 RepID=UPI00254781F8